MKSDQISKLNLGVGIATGVISAVCSIATAIDSIKNGNKRAAIAGDAAGKAAVNETAKRYNRTIFGDMVEVDDQNKKQGA